VPRAFTLSDDLADVTDVLKPFGVFSGGRFSEGVLDVFGAQLILGPLSVPREFARTQEGAPEDAFFQAKFL
jgi:hypothetical protein